MIHYWHQLNLIANNADQVFEVAENVLTFFRGAMPLTSGLSPIYRVNDCVTMTSQRH